MNNHSQTKKEIGDAGVPSTTALSQAVSSRGVRPMETPPQAGKPMKIHPVAGILVALAWPMMGFFFCMAVKKVFKIEIPKPTSSIINLLVAGFGLLLLFP